MAVHHSQHAAGPHAAATGGKPDGKIRAAHLLIKHRDSRRPSSWRENKITRSKDEARTILEGHEQKIQGGAELAELATSESDCSSARKGGDLYVVIGCLGILQAMLMVTAGGTLDMARCKSPSKRLPLLSNRAI